MLLVDTIKIVANRRIRMYPIETVKLAFQLVVQNMDNPVHTKKKIHAKNSSSFLLLNWMRPPIFTINPAKQSNV